MQRISGHYRLVFPIDFLLLLLILASRWAQVRIIKMNLLFGRVALVFTAIIVLLSLVFLVITMPIWTSRIKIQRVHITTCKDCTVTGFTPITWNLGAVQWYEYIIPYTNPYPATALYAQTANARVTLPNNQLQRGCLLRGTSTLNLKPSFGMTLHAFGLQSQTSKLIH